MSTIKITIRGSRGTQTQYLRKSASTCLKNSPLQAPDQILY